MYKVCINDFDIQGLNIGKTLLSISEIFEKKASVCTFLLSLLLYHDAINNCLVCSHALGWLH